jgi:hypothetical protein
MKKGSKQFRILAVSLSSRGFGYAVLEGNNRLISYGHKIIYKSKNRRSLAHICKLIISNEPEVIVLRSVKAKGTHRAPRIKKLHMQVVALAKKHKLRVVEISGPQLRNALLGSPKATKHELAESLAKQFPDELASRLPPPRKIYKSEDSRMDTFDAVGLAVSFKTLTL